MERILEYLKEEFGIESHEDFQAEYEATGDFDIGIFVCR